MSISDAERLSARVWLWTHRDQLKDFTTWELQHKAGCAGWWYDRRYRRDALADHLKKRAERWHNEEGGGA